MTAMNIHELGQQIEKLVRDHIAACQEAAAGAVGRAFASANREPKRARQRARPSTEGSRRRTADEIAALGERFYEAVCAMPGETMAVLAPRVGGSPRTLQVPVARLKRAGRVRSMGKRQYTKYFPTTTSSHDPG